MFVFLCILIGIYVLQVAFMSALATRAIFWNQVPPRLVLFGLAGNLIPYIPLFFLAHTFYLMWKDRNRVKVERPNFTMTEEDPMVAAKLQMAAEHFQGLQRNRGGRIGVNL